MSPYRMLHKRILSLKPRRRCTPLGCSASVEGGSAKDFVRTHFPFTMSHTRTVKSLPRDTARGSKREQSRARMEFAV